MFPQEVAWLRVSQGFWGTRERWQNIEGNKGQGNISQFVGTGNKISKNYSTKTFWESVGTWEHRAILEGISGLNLSLDAPAGSNPPPCHLKGFVSWKS